MQPLRSDRARITRRAAGAAALGLAGVVIFSVAEERPEASPEIDQLGALISSTVAGMSARQPYRPPTAEEQSLGRAGFRNLLDAGHALPTELDQLGFTSSDAVDPLTGRPYTMALGERKTERSWGLIAIDRSAPLSLVVEVPHPAFDLRTELIGLDLFRKIPGALLLMAGAHRKADNGQADVAHERDSLYQSISEELAERHAVQLQLHGFHDQARVKAQVLVSTGSAAVRAPALQAANHLSGNGFTVRRAWTDPCAGLDGKTNVQGEFAAKMGSPFLHVELCRNVRDSPDLRGEIATSLAKYQ